MQHKNQHIGTTVALLLILPLLLVGFMPNQCQAKSQVLVRYFHTNIRCQTCLAFEDWAKTSVDRFPKELANGDLKWEVINTDIPANKHYEKDYALNGKALIIAHVKDGTITDWENIDDFWQYWRAGKDQKEEFVDDFNDIITYYLGQ